MYKSRIIVQALLLITSSIILSACSSNSTTSKISLIPEPLLGKGVYRIQGNDLNVHFIWSPKVQKLAGLMTTSPFPAPDCPPHPVVCWLFSEDKKFNSEITIVDLESNQRQIIFRTGKNEDIISRFFWFPDGQHIGFLIYDNQGHETGTWSIDLQGNNKTRVSQDNTELFWNHGAAKAAVIETSEKYGGWYSDIYIVDKLKNQKQKVFETRALSSFLYGISWSYNDKILAYSYGDSHSDVPEKRPKIFFIDLESGKTVQFTSDRFEEYKYPQFSPVNNLIAFERYQPSFYRYTTVIKDLDTNCQIELPVTALADSVSWSPDGQKILISNINGNYIVDLSEFIGSKFKETGSICS